MTVKQFVLGCSGTGKSTAAHHILELAREAGYSAIHISDYEILYKLFKVDTEAKFRQVEYGGFDVLDPVIYDEALIRLEQEAKRLCSQENQLAIVEFARDDYSKALKLFSEGFLQDAYFLYHDAKAGACKHRIHERAIHPATIDDHFVPDHIVEDYHHEENRQYITCHLKTDFGITKEVEIIDNTGSQQEFLEKVRQFAERIFQQEM